MTTDEREANFIREYAYLLVELARLSEVVVNEQPPAGTHQDVIDGFAIAIQFPEKVISKEQLERTQREIEKTRKDIDSSEARLANDQFVANAPTAVVEALRSHLAQLHVRLEKLLQNQ